MKPESKLMLGLLDRYATGMAVLYVGCHALRRYPKWSTEIQKRALAVDALEIWPPNAAAVRSRGFFREVHDGDIRTFNTYQYGLVFWWHGPEHVSRQEALDTLTAIPCPVIAGCPHGIYEQGPEYGNPNEIHQTHFLPEDFHPIGYGAEGFGPVNGKRSNIILWKE